MDAKNNGELEDKLNGALAKRPEPLEMQVIPVADIYETAGAFSIRLDMPGAARDSIQVSVQPGYLSAKGVVNQHEAESSTLWFGEIGRKKYFREFNLGQGVNQDDIQAGFEDGVLTITVPKTDEIKAREIKIM